MASDGLTAAYKLATTTSDVALTTSELTAGARHLGQQCAPESKAFTECKAANGGDPTKCVAAGIAITRCTTAFFAAMKVSCGTEFDAQSDCLDSNNMEYGKCRATQSEMDVCIFQKMGLNGAFRTYDTVNSGSSYN